MKSFLASALFQSAGRAE